MHTAPSVSSIEDNAVERIKASKLITRIVSCFALPQSYPTFAISWSFAPLLAHVGAGHKASFPLASKLAVELGF